MGLIKILLVIIFVSILLAGAAYGGFVYGQMSINKNSVEIEIPVKQDVTLALDQEINFPVEKTIIIKKSLPINTSIMIDTLVKVPVNVSGTIVYVDVQIKKEVPISTALEINEPISIAETINVPIKKDIVIPIDTTIKTRIPLPWGTE